MGVGFAWWHLPVYGHLGKNVNRGNLKVNKLNNLPGALADFRRVKQKSLIKLLLLSNSLESNSSRSIQVAQIQRIDLRWWVCIVAPSRLLSVKAFQNVKTFLYIRNTP